VARGARGRSSIAPRRAAGFHLWVVTVTQLPRETRGVILGQIHGVDALSYQQADSTSVAVADVGARLNVYELTVGP
jgi:hypothetical protein